MVSRITDSQNSRKESDLWKPPGPSPLLKNGLLELIALPLILTSLCVSTLQRMFSRKGKEQRQSFSLLNPSMLSVSECNKHNKQSMLHHIVFHKTILENKSSEMCLENTLPTMLSD